MGCHLGGMPESLTLPPGGEEQQGGRSGPMGTASLTSSCVVPVGHHRPQSTSPWVPRSPRLAKIMANSETDRMLTYRRPCMACSAGWPTGSCCASSPDEELLGSSEGSTKGAMHNGTGGLRARAEGLP